MYGLVPPNISSSSATALFVEKPVGSSPEHISTCYGPSGSLSGVGAWTKYFKTPLNLKFTVLVSDYSPLYPLPPSCALPTSELEAGFRPSL